MGTTGDTISVFCSCGKKLKAPASAVGRRAKCPACGNVLTLELPAPPPMEDQFQMQQEPVGASAYQTPAYQAPAFPAPPAQEAEEEDPFGAMYDLANAEKQAAASGQVDDSPRCPQCSSAVPNGAVLCVNCGHDFRSGKALATKKETPPPLNYATKKGPVDRMAPQGSFGFGLLCSVGFALGGGLVWFLITWLSGYDIYLVCMLVGILAGLGMQIGQKGYSNLGGWAAVGVTFVVLILGRLAVVIAILIPMIRASSAMSSRSFSPSPSGRSAIQASSTATAGDDEKEELISDLTDEQLTRQKIDPEEATDAQRESAEKIASVRVAAMSPKQRTAELTRLQAAQSAAIASAPSSPTAAASAGSGKSLSAAIGGLVIALLFFGWKSTLFMIFSLFTAFRTASGTRRG